MRKLLVFAAIAAALVAAVLWSRSTRGTSEKEVEVATVERGIIQSSILASGTLAYREQVQLRSEVIARVTELNVEEADRVQAGDLIIRLDPEAFEAAVEQQEANVRLQDIAIERQRVAIRNIERRFERQQGMFARNLIDEDTYDLVENELALARVDLRSREESLSQARAALAQARERLDRTEIRSPIDGIVIQVDVKVGETVIAGTTNIPGSTLVIIADPSEMLVEVQVDEADIAQVIEGQRADVFAAAYPDDALPGGVESIATMARRATGQQGLSFEVKIKLDDPESLGVRPGMSARVDIYTESSDNAVSVPVQAVLYEEPEIDLDAEDVAGLEEKTYVFLMVDGQAQRRDVELGISSDSAQEITAGLDEGQQVISGPYRTLRDLREGDPVTVEEQQDDDDA